MNYTYSSRRSLNADYGIIEIPKANELQPVNFYSPTRVTDTPFIGANGGFFDPNTGSLLDISYDNHSSQNHLTNSFETKTLIVHDWGNSVSYAYVSNMDQVFSRFTGVTAAVGGRDFNTVPSPNTRRSRTFIAYKGTRIFIGVTLGSHNAVTISELRADLTSLGLDPVNTVNLDGGGSTKMQARNPDGYLVVAGSIENRKASSMVAVRRASK